MWSVGGARAVLSFTLGSRLFFFFIFFGFATKQKPSTMSKASTVMTSGRSGMN
jgi:hypothetical protein